MSNSEKSDSTKGSNLKKVREIIKNDALYKDSNGECYVEILRKGAKCLLKINSEDYRGHIYLNFEKSYKQAPTNKIVNDAIEAQSSKANYHGTSIEVHTRAYQDQNTGKIWVDLATEDRKYISIDKDGWEVTDTMDGYFYKTKNMIALPIPQRDHGDINLLKKYINITDQEQFILVTTALAHILATQNPQLITVISGEQA